MIVSRLRIVLAEHGWSVAELARRSELSYSSVHPIYAAKVKRLDIATLDRLCRALDCQVGDLLEYRP